MESDVTCECLSDKSKLQGKENNQVQRHSVQFSRSVLSDSLQPHGPWHARPPYPSPTPGIYSNSCPLSRWCHPTILSSVVPFSHPQSLPASGLFKSISSSHQVAKVLSFSFSINPSDEYSGLISFRMDWLDLLAVQGTLHNDKNVNPPKRHRNPKWYVPDNRTAKYLKQKLKEDTDNSTIIVGNFNSTLSTNRTWRKLARA